MIRPEVIYGLSEEADDVLTRRDTRDRPCEDVIEHQSRDREFSQCPSHRLLDYSIDTSSREHRTTLDIDGSDGIGEEHYAEDEPWSRTTYGLLGYPSDVIG